ncbi:MAG: TauD/TfdA family dioxygenase [Rhodospirillaceae bacterium]
MEIRPLGDALGAEIRGINIAAISDEDLKKIKEAFLKYHVVVFPKQDIKPQEHIEFSKKLGALEIHISKKYLLANNPEILVLSNRKKNGEYVGVENAGDYWHSDLSYMERPSLGSLLYAMEIPEVGGDTEWANQYKAYDALPKKIQKTIDGRRAIHTFNRARNPRVHIPDHQLKDVAERYERISPPDAYHPIVRTHPETGRKALFVSPRFTIGIEGMGEADGQKLLDQLFDYAVRPEFVYHHKWCLGDLLMWDNRCLLHLACRGIPEGQIRHMHRTTLSGDIPF